MIKNVNFVIGFLVSVLLTTTTAFSASASTTIQGRVLGFDGKRLPRADVHVGFYDQESPFLNTKCDSDGRFRVTIKESGLIHFTVTGISHYEYDCPLFLDGDSISIYARLKHIDFIDSVPSVKVIGSFNNYSSPITLEKKSDGTYFTTIPSKENTIAYELIGLDKYSAAHSFNAVSTDYEYDGGGDYRSVVPVINGKAEIMVDPRDFYSPNIGAHVEVSLVESASYLPIHDTLMDHERHFKFLERTLANTPQELMLPAWQELEFISSSYRTCNNSIAQQLLLMEYLKYGLYRFLGGASIPDTSMIKRVFTEIAPNSPLWEIAPPLIDVAVALSHFSDTSLAYLASLLNQQKSDETKQQALFNAIDLFRTVGQSDNASQYYERLVAEYPTSKWAVNAKAMFATPHNMVAGKVVPHFRIQQVGSPALVMSDSELQNKYYLMDFWATWCGPCVAEIPNTIRAYQRFHSQGLEVVSVSLDRSLARVNQFLEGGHALPGIPCIDTAGLDGPLAKSFEVFSIPMPILIGPDRKILAIGGELRGKNLETTLSRLLPGKN